MSAESKALRRSHKLFKQGVDPNHITTVLYSKLLLTREEHERAINIRATDSEKVDEILTALERRVSVNPSVLLVIVQALMAEPALRTVGQRIKGEFG